jgi:hypothetical protein
MTGTLSGKVNGFRMFQKFYLCVEYVVSDV